MSLKSDGFFIEFEILNNDIIKVNKYYRNYGSSPENGAGGEIDTILSMAFEEENEYKIITDESNMKNINVEKYQGEWYEDYESTKDRNPNGVHVYGKQKDGKIKMGLYFTRKGDIDFEVTLNNNEALFEAEGYLPSTDGKEGKITGKIVFLNTSIKVIVNKSNVEDIKDGQVFYFIYKYTQSDMKESNTRNEDIKLLKEKLSDKSWLEKNIYITDEENYNKGDISDQKVNFVVYKGNTKPIIFIKVKSDNARYVKTILVTLIDNNVVAKKIIQGHIYHGETTVDTEKGVICSEFMHMGDNSKTFYNIINGNLQFIGKYETEEIYANDKTVVKYFIFNKLEESTEVTKQEYEKYKEKLNETQYNFSSINIEMTNKNIDEYIK